MKNLKRTKLMMITMLWAASLLAQVDLTQFENMKPRAVGPAVMSGRVTSIDAVVSNPEIIVIGTASGGVWKSVNGGITWDPIFDSVPLLNIGAVAIQQSNPDVIWAGTGEGNPRNSHSSGAGIYKSLDGGRNWMLMGLENTRTIHRILIDPQNPENVYVAAMGNIWGNNPDRGVFKTSDGGTTWKKVLYVNDGVGAADLVMDPQNPGKLFASMWEYGRKPWTFNSGGPGSGLYMTVDGGKVWKKLGVSEGLPADPLGRIGLAIAPSKPMVVYALIESAHTALFRSDDGGYKWHQVADDNIGNRPFYYADIYVDPKNENRIFNLYSIVTKSEDGGKTFSPFIRYDQAHPDHHAFYIHPSNTDFLLDGNDGGLYISRDGGNDWAYVENLPVGQYYHINYDMEIPYNIYGGMQDNGSWVGPAYTWKYCPIDNHEWQELYFGDGFDVVPDQNDSRFGYAMSQGGSVGRYDRETGLTNYVKPVHPKGEKLRFNWNAAIAVDPHTDCSLYFGSQYVHHSTDCGKSWTIISPDLTTNDTSKQKQIESGGLTIDATNAENYTTILAIAPSPLENGLIWVSTDDGHLQITRDGGKNWKELSRKLKDLPTGSWIPQVVPSSHHAGEAFVVANDYRRDNWAPYVYHTMDYGNTWKRIVDKEDVPWFTLSIVQDPVKENLLFLGTETGMYMSMDKGASWQKWVAGLPSVSVIDLKIHPMEGDLIIGTFGRSAYILDDIRPLRAISDDPQILNKDFTVFEIPDAVQAVYKRSAGARFGGDATFGGTNRASGARITYWLRPFGDSTDQDLKDRHLLPDDKIWIRVLNDEGDTIRTFREKPEVGMNRFTWNLRRDGYRFPSYHSPEDKDIQPSGLPVEPGNYTLVITFQQDTLRQKVEVLPDPRLDFNQYAFASKEAYINRYDELLNASYQSTQQLLEARETVGRVNQLLANAPDSVQQDFKKAGREITKKINVLFEYYMIREDFEGYDNVTERVSDWLYNTNSMLIYALGEPGENGKLALQNAELTVKEAVNAINEFFAEDWAAYRQMIESTQLPIFKDFDRIEVKW